jgi:hypothetical protein
MGLVGRSELSFTVRAHPTRHAADCAAGLTADDQAPQS